jgi:hypothetical protein
MLTSYGETIRARYIIGLFTEDLADPIFYGTLLTMILIYLVVYGIRSRQAKATNSAP